MVSLALSRLVMPGKFTVSVVMGTLYTVPPTTKSLAVCSMAPSRMENW